MPPPPLQFAVNRVYTPLRLPPDLVVGTIRWHRQLGLPEGRLVDAFVLNCWSVQVVTDYDELSRTRTLRLPHPIELTEGPHDADYFRVTFSTTAVQPRGTTEPNHLTAQFNPAVKWPVPHPPLHLHRRLAPPEIDFGYVNEAQVLAPIEVVYTFDLATGPVQVVTP